MNIEQIQLVHEAIKEGQWVEAANLAFVADGSDVRVQNKKEALLALRSLEKNLAESERYLEYAVLLWGNIRFDSRPKAARDVFEAVINNHKLIILGASSMSKCLGPDVSVMMFNGSIKPAKEIKAGDILMGDDFGPRNVNAAHSGSGPMYMIYGSGNYWTCNDAHIITLLNRASLEVTDVELRDYLKWNEEKRNDYCMFRASRDGIKKAFYFQVTSLGVGPYNGFLIDGNHRFLLGDFTVTHNTYSCGVLFYLYWRSDPYWTAIKLAGPSEDHLYGNLFSHIVGLHKAAAIPMTDDDVKFIDINETEMSIGMHDAIPEMRIQCVLCKQNQISASGLRGHKPKPMRPYDHPKLGRMTRIYILIDEGTHVSPGAFEDIKTTEASINPNTDSVKIVMACNPEGIDYRIVQLAEPEGGWEVEQVDELFRWKSAKGYEVLRLDGKKSENVIERKIIYEGLLSYETFLDFLRSGEHSGPYWAKGRGFPPLKDNAWTIVPPSWMQSQRGEPVYVGSVKNIGMHDTALGGSDKALFGIGRWGEASGWMDFKGNVTPFTDRTNPAVKITKHVAVLDQIFQLPKSDSTVEIMQEIMGRCKMMGIPAENLAMDKTGNASGVWSHAKTYWGDVLGVDFGTKADESKVVSEDMHNAYDLYDGKVTELWFAMKRWMDPTVCALLISPIVPTSPMFSHVTTRRYRNVKGGRVRVEPKQEYKARNQGVSPDEADILCLLVEWCRQRGGVLPGVVEKRDNNAKDGENVSSQNADEPDNLDGQEWVGNSLEVL